MSVLTLPCLTLREPYASLVLDGHKTFETRTTGILRNHRGPLLIHVSAKSPGSGEVLAGIWDRYRIGAGVRPFIAGHIAGVVNVEDVWRQASPDAELDRQALFSVEDRWLARLTRPTWLTRPIPARGRLGLWKATVPVEVLPEWVVEVSRG